MRRRRSTRQHIRLTTRISTLNSGPERLVYLITRTYHQEEHESIYSSSAEVNLGRSVQGQKRGCPSMAFAGMQCVDYEYPAFILVQLGNVAPFEISKSFHQMHTRNLTKWTVGHCAEL
jgi:hypothetical protein